MHRLILNAPDHVRVDHRNGDGLDNRRDNLRYATTSQNCGNQRVGRNNTSGYKGVTPRPSGKWRARIMYQRQCQHLGEYETKEDAARAYNEAALRLFGPFARLNPIESRWQA